MELDSISLSELQRFLSERKSTQSGVLGVVLINGVTIYGVTPHDNLIQDGKLRLELNERHNEKAVEVPLQHISGVYGIELSQNGPAVPPYGGDRLESAKIWMYGWTQKVAEQYDYEIEDLNRVYNITLDSGFNLGDVKFDSRTPLYCDWEYLSNKAGGVSSVGISAMGFGGSAGWDSSLWEEFEDLVEKDEIELDQIKGLGDVVVTGYVDFLEKDASYETEEMEGDEWFAALITNSRPSSEDDVSGEWAICYFRGDSFMFPRQHWDKISEPIHIFGEVVDANIETSFGKTESYLKARACAYLD